MSRSALFGAILCAPLVFTTGAVAQDVDVLKLVPYDPNVVPVNTNDGAQYSSRLSDIRRPPEWFIGIYSGLTLGGFYYVASGVCEVMMSTFDQHRIHCTPLRSEGSEENIHLMNSGHAQAVLIRTDIETVNPDNQQLMPRARSGFSLIKHAGVMIVARNSGINSIADLPGKSVNFGVEGSETRQLWHDLLEANGLSLSDLGEVITATRDDNLHALCDGEIDAFLSLVGLLPPALINTGQRCGARVVSLETEKTPVLAEDDSDAEEGFDSSAALTLPHTLDAFDYQVSMLFHEEVPNYVTCHITKALYENSGVLLAQHLALVFPDQDQTQDADKVPPLHPGVEQFLKDRSCAPVPTVSHGEPTP